MQVQGDMVDQIVVIDLVEDEDEAAGEKTKSYQDKIFKLETKVAPMEQEIDGIKKMISDHKNSSNELSISHSCTSHL
ncbi:hypothetical protein A4A49_52347 [Nicotiana attenuata]|uniref:Uncharacterized protein n=1 Tax=Nicotiana attenuata TaxID=49451 RepID=A0A1J6J4U2_NICAT|nr:hypothetical protein A4A49_52347 [Nicotiana attenuata]